MTQGPPSPSSPGRPAGTSPSGMWIGKHGVSALGFPFAHTYRATEGGWEIEVAEAGELVLRFLDGTTQTVPLSAGDRLVSSGDDVYVAAQAGPRPPRADGDGDGPGKSRAA